MKERVFLMGDVDAIKSYVFETSSLPQIRGGSQHLVECEQRVQEYVRAHGGRTLYCAGGGFLFEVPADRAEKIKRGIERIYLDRTLVATVTVVYEEAPASPPSAPVIADGWAGRLIRAHRNAQRAGDFTRRVAFLAARLREAKQQKQVVPFMEAFPFGKRCDVCGRRVAEKEITYTSAGTLETKRVCRVCFQRHETGRTYRHQGFAEFLKTKEPSLQSIPPKDLNELVASARRPYVAFFYADGNNIGGLLQKVKDEEEYAALSRALTEGTKQALYETLWEVCQKPLKQEQVWPFEILNIGGDDVTLLIQAGYAWEVAIAFLDRFERHVHRIMEHRLGRWPHGWPERITASVGIAVADARHPVRYLEALAQDLLKRAKKIARNNHTSAVDFLWLPNAIAITKAEMLMDQYQKKGNLLTARPYTLRQARKVHQVVQILSNCPRSLRHRWGEALERGVLASLSMIVYDLARRPADQREEMLALLQTLFPNERPPDIHPPVWWPDEKEKIFRTALLDALELAELRAMRPDIQEEGD